MATTSTPRLMTAEEFLRADLGDGLHELVRGELVSVTPPNSRHGSICHNLSGLFWVYSRQTGYGHGVSNDSAILTRRDPDSVRGPDFAFYSHVRWPKSQVGEGLPPVPPDLVVEVVSPGNRPADVKAKLDEYLEAGVFLVWLVHPQSRTIAMYRSRNSPRRAAGRRDRGPARASRFPLPGLGGLRRLNPRPREVDRMSTAAKPRLMTAEEFMRADLGEGTHELVRGEIVSVTPPPNHAHGLVCANLAYYLSDFGRGTGFGYCLSNDSAVLTRREPDSVRGADLCFYSEARRPRSEIGATLTPIAPDLIVEVVSPGNRRGEMLAKVAEYLDAGTLVVWLVYPKSRSIAIYRDSESPPVLLQADDAIADLPELPGFRCLVSEVFA